jgi:hypothetical protein
MAIYSDKASAGGFMRDYAMWPGMLTSGSLRVDCSIVP